MTDDLGSRGTCLAARWFPSRSKASASRAEIIGHSPNTSPQDLRAYRGRRAELSRYPRTRAGRNRIARSKAKMASNERPTKRKGKDRSHTRGQRMRARMATGQHSTNKTHHKSKVFIGIALHSCA